MLGIFASKKSGENDVKRVLTKAFALQHKCCNKDNMTHKKKCIKTKREQESYNTKNDEA